MTMNMEPDDMIEAMFEIIRRGPQPADAPGLPSPACPRCLDRGFWYPALPPEDPRYGKVVPCACSIARLAAEREGRLAKAWATSGVPKRLMEARLNTHPNLTEGQNGTLLWDLHQSDYEEASWYFWGMAGRGKSGLAAAYAWDYLTKTGMRPMFWRVIDLLNALKASYEPGHDGPTEAQILQRCRTPSLLVLDDLGREQHKAGSEWTTDRLYTIIAGRHAEMLPTVFTSNDADLKRRYDPYIAGRIIEMCGLDHFRELRGRDLRGGMGAGS